MNRRPLLQMRGISKRFPGVVALDGVDLDVQEGEVVGLIGENGAGKSTLMKVLGGIQAPDAGQIMFDGKEVQIGSVGAALKLGVAFIHQELNVLDNLDVAGNIFLGREPVIGPLRLIDRREMRRMAESCLARLGLDIRADTQLSELSIARQQLVEIAKALSLNARIVVMDEPTSSLTLAETERLLGLVKELRGRGVSVIYISHRLGEIAECADRVVGLRDGRNAGSLDRDGISHDGMVRLMIGRDIRNHYVKPGHEPAAGFFRVDDIGTRAYPDRKISFAAGRGEILGFAGLVGAGRSELAEAIFGLYPFAGGEINIGGQKVEIRSVRDAIRQGIFLVPEDRRAAGLVTEMTIRENITLPALGRYSAWGLVSRARETAAAEEQKRNLGIRAPDVESVVLHLSGGNQQKVVLAKWLSMEARVVFFDEPSRGIDVQAKSEIYRLMRELAGRGAVVIMISSDMEELLNVSDRVAVMHEGGIAGILDRCDCSEERIMRLAVGGVAGKCRERREP